MKIKQIAAVLLSAAALTITFAACGSNNESTCDHFYKISDGKCIYCGEEHPHEWNDGKCIDCGYVCVHSTHNPVTMLCDNCGKERFHDYRSDNGGKCTMCNETSSYEHYAIPEEYRKSCEHKGTIEKVIYSTYSYTYDKLKGNPEGTTAIEKDMYVYLPYGYTAGKKYNVLYLFHGSTGSQSAWFGLNGYKSSPVQTIIPTIIDNLIYKRDMAETIIVTPTYYPIIANTDKNPLGSEDEETMGLGYGEYQFTVDFYKELKNAIIPTVETKYSTYADCYGKTVEETVAEDFTSSRRHRAMAGLSMGSITTWESGLLQSTDYISTFGCYAAAITTVQNTGINNTPEETTEYIVDKLNEKFSGYTIDFLYSGTGTAESHDPYQKGLIKALINDDSDWFTAENTVHISKLDKVHNYEAWTIDLYNSLKYCFFKNV